MEQEGERLGQEVARFVPLNLFDYRLYFTGLFFLQVSKLPPRVDVEEEGEQDGGRAADEAPGDLGRHLAGAEHARVEGEEEEGRRQDQLTNGCQRLEHSGEIFKTEDFLFIFLTATTYILSGY